MNISIVYNEVPNKEHSTDSYCAFLIIKALSEADHNVFVTLLLPQKCIIGNDQARKKWLEKLEELDIKIKILPGDYPQEKKYQGMPKIADMLRRIIFPKLIDYFPHVMLSTELEKHLKALHPDVIFSWGNWPPVAALHGIDFVPRFVFVGDPPHKPASYRNRPPFIPIREIFSLKKWYSDLRYFLLGKMSVRLLSEFDAVAATAAHHAEWYRNKGVKNCKYLPNIVPDWGGLQWEKKRQFNRNNKLRIVLLGHLQSTSSLAGFYFFANRILPHLKKNFHNKFEIHICGKGELPLEIMRKLDDQAVYLRGYVDDIVSELFASDILLVPTPIKLGIRVRIAYAWTTGICVVAHQSNACGMPELKHEQNVLLASSGKGLSNEIIRLSKDPDLKRRIALGGRRTYERYFAKDVSVAKILKEIQSLDSSHKINSPRHVL